jgi:ligand-binding sensor domain-containing protein/two-component sensor histidine kinase
VANARLRLALLLGCTLLNAARLPIKTYTTADGLARDHILAIFQDSHGFLWFGTAEGLSRFDGYQFANYRVEQGLPSNVITDFLETRSGVYWVATNGGLCRFDPGGAREPLFQCLPTTGDGAIAAPGVLYEDRGGTLWCGSDEKLFRLDNAQGATFRAVDFPAQKDTSFTSVVVDRRGTLWAGASTGLYRRDSDGAIRVYTIADGLPNHYVMALLEDRAGSLWVGTRIGLVRIDAVAAPGQPLDPPPRITVFTPRNGLPSARVESLLETSGGTLWVGTNEGIAQRVPGAAPGHEFQSYTLAQGLSARAVGALAEDRDGNLWIGTFGSGAMKVAHSGFLTYGDADGVPNTGAIMESRRGELVLLSRSETDLQIARFDGRRFSAIRPGFPKRIAYYGWGRGQIAVDDQAGHWWIATGEGLCRFPSVSRVEELRGLSPEAIYTTRDGLAGNGIFRVYEDSRGDIWIGTIGPNSEDGLARWRRSTGKIENLAGTGGLPEFPAPNAFAEDREGDVWIAMFHGGVARYHRATSRFTTFAAADGVVGGGRSLYCDSVGRLWIGTTRGLIRLDEPSREKPQVSIYTTAQGLSSNFISGITEDRWGRIYAATGRGIDRFEPRPEGPGRVKHYTTADGIAPGELDLALRDRHGALWFTTPLGVSRLVPSQEAPRSPPPVLLTGLSVGGVPHRVSDLGESSIAGFPVRRAPLRIDFVGLDYSPGEALRYQYMLEGADRGWGPLTDHRTVVYASLSPGRYRFLVRAVSSDGATSPQPATLEFTILPPLWRTWWFLSACALSAVGIAFGLHRYRLRQLLAVANVRTRIATDLHDDIGASLSQIAILSEVAQRNRPGNIAEAAKAPLAEIAGIARELIDSMSDIVWATNPEHDRLNNLVYRMRRFSTDLFGSRNIALQFRSLGDDQELRIDANTRRQVYLVFKEAANNIARHSGADRVEVELERAEGRLNLVLKDNGKGFDPAAAYLEGRGLLNIRKRSAALGATLEIRSAPGEGSVLRLSAPLERRHSWSWQR